MNNELYHHGVKGMKWGHHKANPSGPKDTRRSNKLAKKMVEGARFNKASAQAKYLNVELSKRSSKKAAYKLEKKGYDVGEIGTKLASQFVKDRRARRRGALLVASLGPAGLLAEVLIRNHNKKSK